MLTATAAQFSEGAINRVVADAPLPTSFWDDAVFLNGELMAVDSLGQSPVYPIPGRTVTTSEAMIFLRIHCLF